MDRTRPGFENRVANDCEKNQMLDFQRLFAALPGLYIIYDLDFVIVGGSDAYFQATKTQREEVVGRHLFEVFPDNPDDPNADGVRNLRASLESVLKHRQPHTMAIQKYDIRRPESEGGGFEERYWTPVNSPVFNETGEMTHIIHRAEDVTEFVRVQQQRNEQRQLNQMLQSRTDQMEMEIYARAQELRVVNEQLQTANEALSELDRAKTTFFSNVSHEFRTPLTLMLSPLEDTIANLNGSLLPQEREQLQLVQRNGMRLLKLVNSLLDFSRIEAGRVQAAYEPTDLATYTAELASTFRSLIERAGMSLVVDCLPLPEAVYVDREMWEKIVLNLVSNAFKFTFTGSITVQLQSVGNHVELRVADTGVGIPDAELPRLFERFHRVSGTRSRTYEGSGIGLALVQELVKLHGGTIQVTSQLERGTTFTIAIPFGSAHLPSERLRLGEADRIQATRTLPSTALGADPYVVEASRWIAEERDEWASGRGDENLSTHRPIYPSTHLPKILLADDNADMRDYIRRLLSGAYTVETVADGMAALSAIQDHPPDLVLTDVMMPGMDGVELLRALRSNPQTGGIPIILLSARAGEEARLEGLAAGADDYLTKPFSARELLARVEATLKLSKLRQEALQQEQMLRAESVFAQQTAETAWRQIDQLLESMSEAFVALDRDWRITYQNAAAEQINNKPRSEVLGKTLWEEWPAAAGTIFEQQYRHALAEQVPVHFEHCYYEPPDHNVWLEVHAYPFEDGLGIFYRDISDRKQAETELHASEQRFRDLADNAPMMVWVTDPTGFCTYLSRSWYDFTGQNEADGLGFGWLNIVHSDDRESTQAVFLSANQRQESFQLEYRLRRKDGEYRTCIDAARPWFSTNGEFQGYIGSVIDIHDRKCAEAAIESDLNDTRLLRDLGMRLVREDDIQTVYQELVSAAIVLTRADAGTVQILDDVTQELVLLATQGFEQTMTEHFHRVSVRSNTSCGVALRNGDRSLMDFDGPESKDPDGSMRMHVEAGYFSAQSTPLITRSGNPIGMISTHWHKHHRPSDRELQFLDLLARQAADLIEQRQITAEREKLLTREQAARAEADRANRIKDEFLAVLSHELRSPLNPILGWSKLLQQKQLDAATTKMALTTIERNTRLQVQLIDDLLDVSRILRGKLNLTIMPVDLSTVISAALETIRLAAEAKAIQIQTAISPGVGIVMGDAGRLQQVVLNLMSNAVKFTPPAGQVTVALTRTETHAQIQVIDTGKGIKSDFLPHVFEHFRQEDGATTRKFGGLGLGLAIVRQIVELHGGTVAVDSPGEGQGATFTVCFPLAPHATALPAIEQSSNLTADLSTVRILVVDDDTDSREFVAFVLEQAGAIVTIAASGVEALHVFSQTVPDLMVSDIGMPEMNGYMLMRQIRSLPLEQGGQIPAIALTAYAGELDHKQAISAGFQRHIAKPIDPEAVVAIVTQLVSSA